MVALGLIGVSVVLVVLEYLLDFLEGFAADLYEVLDGFGFPDFDDSRDGDRVDEFSYARRGRGYYRHAQRRNKGSLQYFERLLAVRNGAEMCSELGIPIKREGIGAVFGDVNLVARRVGDVIERIIRSGNGDDRNARADAVEARADEGTLRAAVLGRTVDV